MPVISSKCANQGDRQRSHRSESGVTLMVGIAALLFIIPMAGISIDVGVLYTVKARLQSSVDGAALAAARALNLGSTTTAQSTSAKQNAVNWFYANFPTGNWATTNTVMDATSVNVFDDNNNPHLRNVTVTASTSASTYFMKWLGFNAVAVSASGNASRRDVVVMMVLDRSNSMAGVCGTMKAAAKVFTGQFAAGRDMIGLVSFNDSVTLHASPATNFQTVLGYTNATSGSGILDTLSCSGGTGTAQAISYGYNELYRVNLPGALNILMFETDGLPNTLSLSFWDSATSKVALANGSGCLDTGSPNKTVGGGGFNKVSVLRTWAPVPTLGSGSYFTLPQKMVGGVYSTDPSGGQRFDVLSNILNNNSYISSASSPGCGFNTTHITTTPPSDFAWLPAKDIWGNDLTPASGAYKTVTTSGGHVQNSGWTNFHNAALNATDNAAYRARTNPTIPAYFFGIGFGVAGSDPPDFVLMQRMANDPGPDNFNSPKKYDPCASEPGCVTYSDQPQGTFIFSTDSTDLGRAFLTVSSQILRLSK